MRRLSPPPRLGCWLLAMAGWLTLSLAQVNAQAIQLEKQLLQLRKNVPTTQQLKWREPGYKKGATFQQFQREFYQDWAGKKPKKGQGFKPFKRWEDYMAPRVYPSGDMSLPSSTYARFMEWQQKQAAEQGRSRVSALTSSGNWTELGPPAKPAGYDAGVGRIDFVRFHPTNANTLYVCSPDGGLWKTIDGGVNWITNTDFLPIIGCADLVIDPTTPQTMYLATGNRELDRNSIGILKSTNGGATWVPTGVVFQSSDFITIRRLIMDPTNPQVMIAVTNGGVIRTTDGWATFSTPALSGNKELEDAEFKPGTPNTVYALGKDFYKSTDNGATWTQITAGLPDGADAIRALIAVTEADPEYVYTVYGNTSGGYLGTYRSTNSGTSFTERSSFATLNNNILNCDTITTDQAGQASHNLAIAVSPTDAELVSIGGCNVWQSADGGTTWKLSTYWLGKDANYPGEGTSSADYVHADIQSLDYLPGSSSTLYVTSDGGISRSLNNGLNWTDISTNLRVAQMTNVGQSSLTPLNLITGLQDIGTLKNTNGTWYVTNGGDGEDGFIDRTDDNIIITSNPNGAFALSNDGGLTRSNITGLPPGVEFFSPVVQDPVTANIVYAGGRSALYRSTSVLSDADAAWTALGTPVGSGGIKRLVVAPSNNQVIYLIKENSVSKSIDGGATFTDITGTLPVNAAQASNLAVSNTDADRVWVTFSGYEANEKVYKSADGGAVWANVSSGLPNIPMNTIVYTNNSPIDAVYVGADIGVYYMDNATPWASFFTALPNSHVNDLEIYYPTSKIRAATYGRGLWESDLFVTCTKPTRLVQVTDPTCTTPGTIELVSTTGGDKFGIQNGTTYTAPLYASATAIPGTLPVIIKNNISNAADSVFTIRVFKGDDVCFVDTTVTVKAVLIQPTLVQQAGSPFCRTDGTTYTIKFTATGGTVTTIPSFAITGDSIANIPIDTSSVKLVITSVDGCKDTITVAAPSCIIPCVKPDAGMDDIYACVNNQLPTSFDLNDAQAGQKWKIISPVPAGASISITTPGGLVSGTIVAGTYNFLLQTQSDSLNCRDTVQIVVQPCVPPSGAITVPILAYLQGALYGVFLPDTLMRDDLRTKGYLPTTSPYPAMDMTGLTAANFSSAAVVGPMSPAGKDAIVDWVFVELRSDTTTVADSRSALIQRDGDIVDVDGVSLPAFSVAAPGNYFVVVRHRNHLSVMTKNAIALNTTSPVIDFRTISTPTYNLNPSNPINVAQVTVQQGLANWAGNVIYTDLSDNRSSVTFQGADNDVNPIYLQVINAPTNTLVSPTFKLKGYYSADVLLNGEVIYQGANNAVEYIYQNIINHPGNPSNLRFFKIKEQLK